jgi:hypothetical protein
MRKPRTVLGFRRCGRPYCRVSMTKVIWPIEQTWRVPIWGVIHAGCWPTDDQLAMLYRMAAFRRLAIQVQVALAPMRAAMERVGAAMGVLAARLPEASKGLPEPDWSDAQVVTFRDP